MKWKTLVAEVEPFGWIHSGMTVESESLFYHGLLCTVIAVRDEDTGKWDAHLKVQYPMLEPVLDEEIQTDLFWRNYAEPFDSKEDAIAISLELATELVDGKQAGLNDFLLSKVTNQMWDDLN